MYVTAVRSSQETTSAEDEKPINIQLTNGQPQRQSTKFSPQTLKNTPWKHLKSSIPHMESVEQQCKMIKTASRGVEYKWSSINYSRLASRGAECKL